MPIPAVPEDRESIGFENAVDLLCDLLIESNVLIFVNLVIFRHASIVLVTGLPLVKVNTIGGVDFCKVDEIVSTASHASESIANFVVILCPLASPLHIVRDL